jgi:uncharacterized protein YjcR
MPPENWSRTQHEKQMMECAAMDFAGVPLAQICEHFNILPTTVRQWRLTDTYKETADQFHEDFKKDLYTHTATVELRKKIAHGMKVSVHRLIRIVSSEKERTANVIRAAQLLAQMDGRFIKSASMDDEARVLDGATDPLAAELIRAIQSQQNEKKETLQ